MKLIKPLGTKIVVERESAEDTTPGGIVLPEVAKEKPQVAKVIAVGRGRQLDDGQLLRGEVCVGDSVLLGRWGGTEVKIGGHELLVIDESEVLGIVRD